MKGMRNKFFCMVLTLLITVGVITPLTIKADSSNVSSANYDISKGGAQTFTLANENNEVSYVTITELNSLSKVANGTYQVSYTSPGAWRAGFIVSVSKNTFTSAYSPYCSAITGRIITAGLNRNSSTRVSYNISYQHLGIILPTGVRAIISNGVIKVSQI